jgi:hypothetical protein
MRQIEFVTPTQDAFTAAISHAIGRGAQRIVFADTTELSQSVAAVIGRRLPGFVVPPGAVAPPGDAQTVAVLGETDGEKLSAALMAYVDRPSITIIAPVTDRFWNRRSLFLISIPKSGTHMLTELAQAFGFGTGGICPANAVPGRWHFLEFTNSHTAAPDFFIDTVRRAPHGNRAHPFPHHPALFIYRNPLDIVASEANYYHEDGKTAFAGYLNHLTYEERLLRLINDPWLLGSIRERVGKFAAWLDFGSVIPVSFEELVGPRGGGDEQVQLDLVWSLMLRLHVPGNPVEIARKVFNPDSPTFREGRIGGHERRFTPAAWDKIKTLPQDFMHVFGYDKNPESGPWFPSRAAEFRRRVPRYSKADPGDTAFIVKQAFLGHDIWYWREHFWALPFGHNLNSLNAKEEPPLSAPDIVTLEFLVHTKMFLQFSNNAQAAAALGMKPPQAPGAQPGTPPVQ